MLMISDADNQFEPIEGRNDEFALLKYEMEKNHKELVKEQVS